MSGNSNPQSSGSQDSIDEKPCKFCLIVQPLSEYHRSDRYTSGHMNECRTCISKRTRAWYLKNKERKQLNNKQWRKDNPEKYRAMIKAKNDPTKEKARREVRAAVKAGTFEKLDCERCGSTPVEFHHSNGYDKPNWFTGAWLCRQHHATEHKGTR